MSNVSINLSIIIPTLNESKSILDTLELLSQQIEEVDCRVEIIIVDGGSKDNTVALAKPYVDHIIYADKGRAKQMNAGAYAAKGEVLLFLHSDTQLPPVPFPFLKESFLWGFYPVRLSGRHCFFRLIERMISWRSHLTQVGTGDQALFIRHDIFKKLKGYADIPLMEDVEISKRLRKLSPPLVANKPLLTSSRRWEKKGILKTVFLMWKLRFLYFIGVSPNRLIKYYS